MTVYSTNKQKFAWHPVKTYSGKWIWCRHYIKANAIILKYFRKKYLGSKIECRIFTESEWILELLKE